MKNESNKTLIVIIAIAVTIIALIMIKNEYKKYQEEQQIKQMLFGTTNDKIIEMKTKQMIRQTNKTINEFNRQNKKTIEDMKKQFKNFNNITKQFQGAKKQLEKKPKINIIMK